MLKTTPHPIVAVRDLTVSFGGGRNRVVAVKDVSFDVGAGETVAVVGESGSGKSVTALSIMALIQHAGGQVDGGSIVLDGGTDMVCATQSEARAVRGRQVAMVFQEPMTSLNPVLTIGEQIVEPMTAHLGLTAAEARKRAIAAMQEVQIPEPERRFRQFPHELSGGMRQRVMIAMALVCEPKLLICDEPTTALDVTIQAQILWLIERLKASRGTAILFITHDLGVVAQLADRVVVMAAGHVVEVGDVASIFVRPQAPYTQRLLSSVPRLGAAALRPDKGEREPMLELDAVTVRYPIRSGILRRARHDVLAADRVSLSLKRGTTLGLVGESGCGKSTIARAAIGLVAPTEGTIRVGGKDVTTLAGSERKALQRTVSIIFQDPFAALSPRRTAVSQIIEPMLIHGLGPIDELRARALDLLERVGLDARHMERYPHEFSGGQRQRLCIARALALGPDLVIADEPVSALDVSVQARVLKLLKELQDDLGLTYLFISHDLAVVEQVADEVAVMYMGRIVERGATAQVLHSPKHPYTQNLLASVPVPDPERKVPEPTLYRGSRQTPVVPAGAYPEAAPAYVAAGPRHEVISGTVSP